MSKVMPDNALVKKLKLKPGQRAAVINAPADYLRELEPLPSGAHLSEKLDETFDWVQVFVKSKAELDRVTPLIADALRPDSVVWVSFPKGSSNIQTDLSRDKGWDSLAKLDLRWITLVSVNDTWSAFSLRPFKPGEARPVPRTHGTEVE